MSEPRVVVLTTAGCHLCAVACDVVARVAAGAGVEWRERDLSDDPELAVRWRDFVPVVFVDGEVHDWFRVDPDRLRAALGPAAPAG